VTRARSGAFCPGAVFTQYSTLSGFFAQVGQAPSLSSDSARSFWSSGQYRPRRTFSAPQGPGFFSTGLNSGMFGR
jgi:hypothetical protein